MPKRWHFCPESGHNPCMSTVVKWIGGASAAVALLFGALAVGSYAFENKDNSPTLTAEDVLDIARMDEAEESDGLADASSPAGAESVVASDDPFVIKRILPIQGPIRYGEWHWDEEGVPDGPLVMTVDLEARVISVFRGGYEIGAAAVLLGTQDHPTPLGRFPILEKKRHNISSIYNVPMPYTMRLTWDGIAIHSSQVENGYASHGCIGTPDEFAAKLFSIAQKGDIVIITRGKTTGLGQPLIS